MSWMRFDREMDEVYEHPTDSSQNEIYAKVSNSRCTKPTCMQVANLVLIIACMLLSSAAFASSFIPRCEKVCTNSGSPTAAATVSQECPEGYTINPYAKSCIHLVNVKMNWSSAKTYCEESGEYLATFETLESMFYFINLRKIKPAWSRFNLWLGGNESSTNEWRWQGKTTQLITQGVWANEEPNDHKGIDERCLATWYQFNYTLNDAQCNSSLRFVCEKLLFDISV